MQKRHNGAFSTKNLFHKFYQVYLDAKKTIHGFVWQVVIWCDAAALKITNTLIEIIKTADFFPKVAVDVICADRYQLRTLICMYFTV